MINNNLALKDKKGLLSYISQTPLYAEVFCTYFFTINAVLMQIIMDNTAKEIKEQYLQYACRYCSFILKNTDKTRTFNGFIAE